MVPYSLEWPPDLEEWEWQLESKGWFQGLMVTVEGRSFTLEFYDPVRLSQEVEYALAHDGVAGFSRLIVIERVNRETMIRAVENLASSGELRRFLD